MRKGWGESIYPLWDRRLRGDMIETYKVLTGLYDPDTQPLLELDNNQRTRGHPYKLLKPRCRTSHRLNTFTHRIVNPWNSLPDSVVDATSIAAFERRLDKHWANLDMKYVYDSNSPVVIKSDQSADFDIPNTDLDIQDHWGPSSSIHLCIYVCMYKLYALYSPRCHR